MSEHYLTENPLWRDASKLADSTFEASHEIEDVRLRNRMTEVAIEISSLIVEAAQEESEEGRKSKLSKVREPFNELRSVLTEAEGQGVAFGGDYKVLRERCQNLAKNGHWERLESTNEGVQRLSCSEEDTEKKTSGDTDRCASPSTISVLKSQLLAERQAQETLNRKYEEKKLEVQKLRDKLGEESKRARRVAELENQINSQKAQIDEKSRNLRESADREQKLQNRISSLSNEVRTISALKAKISRLEREYGQSEKRFQKISERIGERQSKELLDKAEQRMIELQAESDKKIKELESRRRSEEQLRMDLVKGLERKKAKIAQLEKELQEKSQALTHVESNRSDLHDESFGRSHDLDGNGRKSNGIREEDESLLRTFLGNLNGVKSSSGVDVRKILAETLENELTACLEREAALQMKASEYQAAEQYRSVSDKERERLKVSLDYLRNRIEGVRILTKESVSFLRSGKVSESTDSVVNPKQGDD